jgi:hypothetical protein
MVGWISDPQTLEKVPEPPIVAKMAASDTQKETIMLYGKAKVGKTMACCSLIDEAIKANPNVTIHYICTDNGLEQTLEYYFGERTDEIKAKYLKLYKVYEFRKDANVPFFTQVAAMLFEIRKRLKPTDWIIMDLADKFWGWAQDTWIEQSAVQNVTTTYIADAAKDLKKFMEFNKSQWQFVKRLDNIATFDIVDNAPCNLLYVFGEKPLEFGEDLTKRKEAAETRIASDIFDLVGCKPAGQGMLPYSFSTIVYLCGLKDKKFVVLGDRGHPLDYLEKPFGRNWYAAFCSERKK